MEDNKTKSIGSTNELLTKRELAERLKLCTRSVENLVRQRKITCIKIGKSVRFDWLHVMEELKEANNSNAA